MNDSIIVRRAQPQDRSSLLHVINAAFPDSKECLFEDRYPHLFTDRRIGDHVIAEAEGRVVGAVGLYPHQYRIGEVVFDVAGVGQVSVLPELRGNGIMSRILKDVCQVGDRFDFTWLFGDRRRYGRYGWAFGGRNLAFEIMHKYLPPAPKEVEILAPVDAQKTIAAALERLPQTLVFPDSEMTDLLRSFDSSNCAVYRLGRSFVLVNTLRDMVYLADGHVDEIAAIFAFILAQLVEKPGDRWKLMVLCSDDDSPCMRACHAAHFKMVISPTASIRVGNLQSCLSKLCRSWQPSIAGGNGLLSLVNHDNGQQATLCCDNGRLSVSQDALPVAEARSTEQLSDILFGLSPLDLHLPDLPTASPFRSLLPVPIHVCKLFAL